MTDKNNNKVLRTENGAILILGHQPPFIPGLDEMLAELTSPEGRECIKTEGPKLRAEIDAVIQNRLEANMRVREW